MLKVDVFYMNSNRKKNKKRLNKKIKTSALCFASLVHEVFKRKLYTVKL